MKVSNSKERIKELMEYYNISQTDISKRTGIGKSAISQYVSGEREPRQDKVGIISESYGLNPAWLMGFDVPMFQSKEVIENNRETEFRTILEYVERIFEMNDNDRKSVLNIIDSLSRK